MKRAFFTLAAACFLIGAIYACIFVNRKQEEAIVQVLADRVQETDRQLKFEIVRIEFTEDRQSIEFDIEGDLGLPSDASIRVQFYHRNELGRLEKVPWDPLDVESGSLSIRSMPLKIESHCFRETRILDNLPYFSHLKITASYAGVSKSKTFISTVHPDI